MEMMPRRRPTSLRSGGWRRNHTGASQARRCGSLKKRVHTAGRQLMWRAREGACGGLSTCAGGRGHVGGQLGGEHCGGGGRDEVARVEGLEDVLAETAES